MSKCAHCDQEIHTQYIGGYGGDRIYSCSVCGWCSEDDEGDARSLKQGLDREETILIARLFLDLEERTRNSISHLRPRIGSKHISTDRIQQNLFESKEAIMDVLRTPSKRMLRIDAGEECEDCMGSLTTPPDCAPCSCDKHKEAKAA